MERAGRPLLVLAPQRCANCQMYTSDRFCMGTVEQGYCHLTISWLVWTRGWACREDGGK
jgi:hypothetical protein